MAEIKVENTLEDLEKEEGEIDDEFLDYVPSSEETSITKGNSVENTEVDGVTSPVSVVPVMDLVVFTPPSPDKDCSDSGNEGKETVANEHIIKKTCQVRNCHCTKVRKDNQRLMKVISELCRRSGEMDDFFQVEFGERYNAFRNNRKHLIQMGYGKEYDPGGMTKEKDDKNVDVVQLLRFVKEENDSRPKELKEITPPEIITSSKSFASEETQLEISLQHRLSSMSNGKRRNQPNIKGQITKGKPPLRESSKEITDREFLNKNHKKRSSQSRTEYHSSSKRVRFSPPKTTSPIKPLMDLPLLEGCGNVQIKFQLCPICPLMVPSEELMDHLLIIHKKIPNTCPVCKEEFTSRRKLRNHFSSTHEESCAEKFKAFNPIEPEVKKWLSETVDLAIPVTQEDIDSLEEVSGNALAFNEEGWRIYVCNLGPEIEKKDIIELFERFGAIERVNVVRDQKTNKNKGFGFVTMTNYDEAVLAIHSLNGYSLDNNRVLQVSFSKTSKHKLIKCKS